MNLCTGNAPPQMHYRDTPKRSEKLIDVLKQHNETETDRNAKNAPNL